MSEARNNGRRYLADTAEHMAEQICLGFRAHDRRRRREAVDAFAEVDALQFRHVDESRAREAAEAYVDALWEKDAVEAAHMSDGDIDRDSLAAADWAAVEAAFLKRAELAAIDPRYAEQSTVAWRRHKTGGDYWTPIQRAQLYELRAALRDPDYPHKPTYGRSGFGAEAARYALAVELHDMHTPEHWRQAKDVMRPYFEFVLDAHLADP